MSLEVSVAVCLNLLKQAAWTNNLKDAKYDVVANDMMAWLEGGVGRGYSTFFTYRQTYKIYDLIKSDLLVALVSPDGFVRCVAEKISKESVDIAAPPE